MPKKIVQYLVPFWKEKFVPSKQVVDWFRSYNYFHFQQANYKRVENFVLAKYSPDDLSSGICLIGNGHVANYIKYLKYVTVRHRLIIELGRDTYNSWYFGEELTKKNYDHITKEQLETILATEFTNRQLELYDRFLFKNNYKEAPRDSFVNSIEILNFNPPYCCLDIVCQGDLRIVNLVFKLSQLLDCPLTLIDAERYQIEDLKRDDCLTKTDIYYEFINESKLKYTKKIFNFLAKHSHKEDLKRPTHSRYLLYI